MRVATAQYAESLTDVVLELVEDFSHPANASGTLPPEPGVGGGGGGAGAPLPSWPGALMQAPFALTGSNADYALGFAFPSDAAAAHAELGWSDNLDATITPGRRIQHAVSGTLTGAMPFDTGAVTVSLTLDAAHAAAAARQVGKTNVLCYAGGAWNPSDTVQTAGVTLAPEMFIASSLSLAGNVLTLHSCTRGVYDTVPQAHAAGATVVVLFDYELYDRQFRTVVGTGDTYLPVVFAEDGITTAQLRARAVSASGAVSDWHPTVVAELNPNPVGDPPGWGHHLGPPGRGLRAALPYPPGDIRLGGVLGAQTPAAASSLAGPLFSLQLTWVLRERTFRGSSAWGDGDSVIVEPLKLRWWLYSSPNAAISSTALLAEGVTANSAVLSLDAWLGGVSAGHYIMLRCECVSGTAQQIPLTGGGYALSYPYVASRPQYRFWRRAP